MANSSHTPCFSLDSASELDVLFVYCDKQWPAARGGKGAFF
jgi:hypothetical protein